jgi:hypothetical protein
VRLGLEVMADMAGAIDFRQEDLAKCDVLVVGGGAAGLAAATTAAESGLSVILVERYGFCGGGAVAGMSGTVCGLYLASTRATAKPEKVVFGFVDRFISAMEARNGLSEPLKYGHTFTRVHDPDAWRLVADGFLREAGVRVLFHAVATHALVEGDRIEGVVCWTKQGPLQIRAKITIDASGDADIAAMAGLSSVVGRNGVVQNPTMIFRLANVDVGRFKAEYGEDTIMPPSVSDMITAAAEAGEYDLPRRKIWIFPTTRPGELLCNCTRIIGADGRELNTLLRADFSEAESEGRLQAHAYASFFRRNLAGCGDSYVVDTPPQVGVRQTRQIVGKEILRNEDVVTGKKRPNGIAVSPWPIELHSGQRPVVEWLHDDVYEIPFGAFVPERGNGILFAGRCLSAEHEAVASSRVTAQCFSYGHAVGIAAAISIRDGVTSSEIVGHDVRVALNQAGARLGG